MDKKKILVVSKSFYPENSPRSFRTTELVKEFCRQGHDVTLYTLKNDEHHQPIANEFGVTIKDLGKLRFKPVDLTKGNKIIFLLKRVVNRAFLLFFEYPDIELMFRVKKALKNESGYDLMVSVAVPHPVHWGVTWARTKQHRIADTWVADCGDAYMGVIKHDSFGKMFYFKYLEKWLCRKADHIAIPNINMKVNYYPEFRNKILEIPQGFKFDEVQMQHVAPNNPVPTFAFAGVFMRTTRNPVPLLEYLISTKRDFKFIVFTRTAELLLPYKEVLKDKLEIRDYIPRTELIKELSKMDFHINIGFDPAQQAPSKIIDYYLSGRPILSFPTNEVDKKLMDEFLDGNYSNGFRYENVDKFRIENVSKAFLSLCKK
ncbi:MAG: hypothetical protein IPP72_05315 [Chitinophagaceae bacterium]|nr:hypothetical protein [Chitinophagaceae bacterium]